ncbi:uncharacterized protein EAE97_007060 [Botrytis byssoidea]|uniref:Uncharacterized protein n=1 Tax=Botrytis byssoidea TaxID=139641 RepID=A0A9P5IHH1_9HELO|nr:uncharacterized protein EAE97_007060 [Botrytis byssoidea]KAF7940875.1 hypothetical protein EAE97_007060 [Botrytis byssoidea]
MNSSKIYRQTRSNLKVELDKRIHLLKERVRNQGPRTRAISTLRSFYVIRIANTYVDEATNRFASKGLTRKDIENIHRDISNIQNISRQFVNDVYEIVCTPEAKVGKSISYFPTGEPSTPDSSNNTVQDASQASIARRIIRLDNRLVEVRSDSFERWSIRTKHYQIQITIYISSPRRILELITHLESSSPRVSVNNFEMKTNPIISASKASAEASEVTKNEIKRMERRAVMLEEENKRLELEISLRQKEVAAMRKEKANGWIEKKS